MYKWRFSGIDTYGKLFCYNIHANNKRDAIDKGFHNLRYRDAYRNAIRWVCVLMK